MAANGVYAERSTATSYTDPDLKPGTTYHYRVAAINSVGQGAYSNVAAGTTNAAPPSAPRNLRVRASGPKSIDLSWEEPQNDGGAEIAGYRIQRRAAASDNWATVCGAGADGGASRQATHRRPRGLRGVGRRRHGPVRPGDAGQRPLGAPVPSYGDAASGLNQLWDRGISDAVRDPDMRHAGRPSLDGELAYGLPWFRGTPFGGFRLGQGGARAFSSEVRYDLGAMAGRSLYPQRRRSCSMPDDMRRR